MSNNKPLIIHIPKYFPDSMLWTDDVEFLSCCKDCKNNPKITNDIKCSCELPLISFKNKLLQIDKNENKYYINY